MQTVQVWCVGRRSPYESLRVCVALDGHNANVMMTLGGAADFTVPVDELNVSMNSVIQEFQVDVMDRVGSDTGGNMETKQVGLLIDGDCGAKAGKPKDWKKP